MRTREGSEGGLVTKARNKRGRTLKPRNTAVPGPQVVRAWFDTVINPVLNCLERENTLLSRSNWTWQFRTGALEYIRPIRHYVPGPARENLQQFLLFYPKVKRIIDRHDSETETLENACSRLHRTLVNESPLPSVYRDTTSLTPLRSIPSRARVPEDSAADAGAERLLAEYFGGYPPSDHLALLAQYILNNAGDLPDHITTASLWNHFRERFISILRSPSVDQHYRSLSEAGARLRETSSTLSRTLQRERLELSVEYDVPYVDPASIQHSEWPY